LKYPLIIGLATVALLWSIASVSKRKREEEIFRNGDLPNTGAGGTLEDVKRLAEAGEKIAAIKLYRQIQNVGLREAKEAVEQMIDKQR